MNDEKNVAIRKYNAINKANRTMFGAVAIASVIVGASVVGMGFLSREIEFHSRVISEELKTIDNIKQSITNVEEMAKSVQVLQSDDNLKQVVKEDESPLLAILDALPAKANPTAVGSSLSEYIFNGIENLQVDSMNIEPILTDSEEAAGTSASSSATSTSTSTAKDFNKISDKVKTVAFSFVVTAKNGDPDKPAEDDNDKNINTLTEVLRRMEKSIRAFKISSYKIEVGKASASLTVSGTAFYLPEHRIGLTPKVIKLDESAGEKKPTSSSTTGGTK